MVVKGALDLRNKMFQQLGMSRAKTGLMYGVVGVLIIYMCTLTVTIPILGKTYQMGVIVRPCETPVSMRTRNPLAPVGAEDEKSDSTPSKSAD